MNGEAINKDIKKYIGVFILLMVFTGVTVAVSYLDVTTPMAIGLALFIASIKGALVLCFFMHVISEKLLVILVLAFTAVFFLGLILLPVFNQVSTYSL